MDDEAWYAITRTATSIANVRGGRFVTCP